MSLEITTIQPLMQVMKTKHQPLFFNSTFIRTYRNLIELSVPKWQRILLQGINLKMMQKIPMRRYLTWLSKTYKNLTWEDDMRSIWVSMEVAPYRTNFGKMKMSIVIIGWPWKQSYARLSSREGCLRLSLRRMNEKMLWGWAINTLVWALSLKLFLLSGEKKSLSLLIHPWSNQLCMQ